MNRRTFLHHALAAGLGAIAAPLARRLRAAEGAYDFWFTRLMYESGDWDVDQRMPTNLIDALVQYTTLRVDTKASKADVKGVPLKLTSHEFRLLAYLMHHMGDVVSRTELVEHLYDQDFDRDSNTIEVFVGRLRKKMGVDMIETVRGMGYRMREPEA